MATTNPPEDFYPLKCNGYTSLPQSNFQSFSVFKAEDIDFDTCNQQRFSLFNFHKISLLRGHNRYHFAGKSVDTSGPVLLFSNPTMPYTFEPLNNDTTGFCCLFKVPFLSEQMKNNINELPLFLQKGKSSFYLNNLQDNDVSGIYRKMLGEIYSDYLYKEDLLRNYVVELIHYALKISPAL